MSKCEYLVSWVIGRLPEGQGGKLKKSSWDDVSKTLAEIRKYSGVVTLDKLSDEQIGAHSLQVQTENGQSILTLVEDTEDDYIVRSFLGEKYQEGNVEILGNLWDLCSICADFDLVVRIFKEFYETGDVSRQLVN